MCRDRAGDEMGKGVDFIDFKILGNKSRMQRTV
jgi:hypothetical protein